MLDAQSHAGHTYFLRKLRSFAMLSPDEEAALLALPIEVRSYPTRHELVQEGDVPSACHLLLDGFACRYKSLLDGSQQILSFDTPGDIPDLQGMHLSTMDYGVRTLRPTTVGRISHTHLDTLTRHHPGIAYAFRRDAVIDSAIFREWMLGLGRRTARQHLAHMLCEMTLRFRAVGLMGEMPLDKQSIAEALGIPMVQITRELQQLHHDGLVRFWVDAVEVLDFEGLGQICDFDPAYLQQNRGT